MQFPNFDRFCNLEKAGESVDFYATKFHIVDPTDATKRVEFAASGVTTATKRTITLPDFDVTLGKTQPLVGASSLTMTESMSGKLINCGAAEDFVLPTITAANIGMTFEFLVTATASSLTITAAALQLLKGGASIMSTTAGAENDAFSADGTDDLIITMNGTTTGGIVGSYVKMWAVSATQWSVFGSLIGSGTIVTPFS